jgi:hypothetical protein
LLNLLMSNDLMNKLATVAWRNRAMQGRGLPGAFLFPACVLCRKRLFHEALEKHLIDG